MANNEVKAHFDGHYADFYKRYLKTVKQIGGDEYMALCPFHEDKDPSFNFNDKTGQYYCHGCHKKGDPIHFYAKQHGLDTKRDFRKVLEGIADDFGISLEEKPKGKIVEAYNYVDAGGEVIFQVCRKEPKDFLQRRPNGKGGWIYKVKEVEKVLYHLPKVMAAREVIIVEGEKDVESLEALGYTATTNAGGAGKWLDSYNTYLKGKDVILIPDNDAEGQKHMTDVAISLNGTSKSLKRIALTGLPSKGDVSDWIAKFPDKEEAAERLAVMIDNADPYTPPKKATFSDAILKDTELLELNLPPRKSFLHPWLKQDSLGLIYGWRGVGKSWFALAVLDAITKGSDFGPWQADENVPCLFLDGEMPVEDVIERRKFLGEGRRKSPLYIYSDAYANRLGLPRAHLANETWRTRMKGYLLEKKIKVWMIDNLASLAGGLNENAKDEWDPINGWLLELRFAGISTYMLHHESKAGKQRGTAAREDNIDISIRLKKPHDYTPDDGARFIVSFEKARVRTSDLNLITDMEFVMQEDETGKGLWTYKEVRMERKFEVIRLLDEGMSQQDICGSLNISKGHVSKLRKCAIKEGFLSEKNGLTQTGFQALLDHAN